MRTQFRKIFVAMGFEEMPTNNYVESRYDLFEHWCLDVYAAASCNAMLQALLLICIWLIGTLLLHSFPYFFLQLLEL